MIIKGNCLEFPSSSSRVAILMNPSYVDKDKPPQIKDKFILPQNDRT